MWEINVRFMSLTDIKLQIDKDTKNNKTWWCLTAPIRPRIEIRNRITPHAKIPPIIGRFVTKADALPYTATPISIKATTCKRKESLVEFHY